LGKLFFSHSLGNRYSHGEGVERDLEKAIYWYTKAAEQGNASAQNNLGNSYFKGEGVERDVEKAMYWLTKSAQQGVIEAENTLEYLKLFFF